MKCHVINNKKFKFQILEWSNRLAHYRLTEFEFLTGFSERYLLEIIFI